MPECMGNLCPLFEVEDYTVESWNLANRIQKVANSVLEITLASGLLEVPERQAFALTLRKWNVSTPLLKCKVGTTFPDNDFRLGCWDLSEEKVARQFRLCEISSFCSRNVANREFGGAISIPTGSAIWGIGVSGLRELEDEAVAIVITIYTFKIPITDLRIQDILAMSNNHQLTEKILAAVKKEDDGYYEKYIQA